MIAVLIFIFTPFGEKQIRIQAQKSTLFRAGYPIYMPLKFLIHAKKSKLYNSCAYFSLNIKVHRKTHLIKIVICNLAIYITKIFFKKKSRLYSGEIRKK